MCVSLFTYKASIDSIVSQPQGIGNGQPIHFYSLGLFSSSDNHSHILRNILWPLTIKYPKFMRYANKDF